MISHTVGIVGAGAWGTALASVAARAGAKVIIWAREEEVIASINNKSENSVFLAGIPLPNNISATNDMAQLSGCDIVLLGTPAQFMSLVVEQIASEAHLQPSTPLIICAKGIENKTNRLMSEVVEKSLPNHPIAVISGPTFATEVAKGKPTALSLACNDNSLGNELATMLSTDYFRLFYNSDIIGAQITGAAKNVLAIGCGIAAGMELGDNTVAALITLGLHEMSRLTEAKGGKRATMMELCGIGDLVLTCSSMQSRNMSLGYQIGQGKLLSNILGERKSVAEGVATARSVTALAKYHHIDMPICTRVNAILHEGAPAQSIIDAMMQ